MDLFKVALGLIRNAVGDRVGHEVANMVRSEKSENPASTVDVEALLAEHRAHVDRSVRSLVEALREQNARLEEVVRRQRIWNFSLAVGLAIAIVVAILAIA